MTIKAIETNYKGYRFRSRLEARWAVFLDSLGLLWEYEKEGFDLDGLWYLPDFWLPQQRCWMEVKPCPGKEGWEQAYRLAKQTQQFVFIVLGELCPPYGRDVDGAVQHVGFGYGWYGNNLCTWPADPDPIAWAQCHNCRIFGPGVWGMSPIEECSGCACKITDAGWAPQLGNPLPSKCYPADTPDLRRAYAAARSARFEFGEKGAPP